MAQFLVDIHKLLKRNWQLFLKPYEELSERYYHHRLLGKWMNHRELVELILTTDETMKDNWMAYQNLITTFCSRDEKRFFAWLDHYSDKVHPLLQTVLETFRKLTPAIRNSFRTKLTNGFVEGINNKIKVIKRISFGYRSFVNFRTRIMICFTLTKKTAQPLVVG